MACVGLSSASANTAVAAAAGVFSCGAPTGTRATLADFYSSSSPITGTGFVCVTGAAPT